MHYKPYTVCFIIDGQRILLGMKKRGFGAGRWNGFGGKVHDGETVMQAASRELEEEAGVRAIDLRPRGILRFSFEGQADGLGVSVFSATRFSGTPHETEEMRPEWFAFDAIPYTDMWPDDPHWLPMVLAGKDVRGTFHFKDQQTLLTSDVKVSSESK